MEKLKKLENEKKQRKSSDLSQAKMLWAHQKKERQKLGIENYQDWYDTANEILTGWMFRKGIKKEALQKLNKLWMSVCLLYGEAANSQEWKVHEAFYNSVLLREQKAFKSLKKNYTEQKTELLKMQLELDRVKDQNKTLESHLAFVWGLEIKSNE